MPDGHGTDIVQALAVELPFIRCLLMSASCNNVTVHRIEQARSWGFIDKNFHGVAAFRHALAEVAAGRRYFSPMYEEARSSRRKDQQSFDKLLTRREQEVLSLIGASMSDEEIAAMLGLTVSTVATHRRNLLGKLQVGSTPKLIKYALEEGFSYYPRISRGLGSRPPN